MRPSRRRSPVSTVRTNGRPRIRTPRAVRLWFVTAEPPRSGALSDLLREIEAGRWPEADGAVRVIRQPPDGDAAVLGFTAHIVVAADVEPEWVAERLPPGDLSAPLNPPFLAALCERLDRRVNCLDLVAYATALDDSPPVPLTPDGDAAHPRVHRARHYRTDAEVWTTEGGIVVIGRGLAGRLEVAFEVDPHHRGRGLGRALALSARHLVREIEPAAVGVWAQVSPGNVASVRALFAAGYQAVGSEALLVPMARRLPGG
jgi:GNAT superfamily N-acetyltransferase